MKKAAAIFLLAACLTGCSAAPPLGEEPNEEARVEESEEFASAHAMNEEFLLDGVVFCVLRCETSALYPSTDGGRGVYVYIDYPQGMVFSCSRLELCDVDGGSYRAMLPDGLDFLGEYRGETADGVGYARFSAPARYRHFLLKLSGESETASVHVVVTDVDEE